MCGPKRHKLRSKRTCCTDKRWNNTISSRPRRCRSRPWSCSMKQYAFLYGNKKILNIDLIFSLSKFLPGLGRGPAFAKVLKYSTNTKGKNKFNKLAPILHHSYPALSLHLSFSVRPKNPFALTTVTVTPPQLVRYVNYLFIYFLSLFRHYSACAKTV